VSRVLRYARYTTGGHFTDNHSKQLLVLVPRTTKKNRRIRQTNTI